MPAEVVHGWWPQSLYQIKAVSKPASKRCGDHSPGPTDLESQGSMNKCTLTTHDTQTGQSPCPHGGSRETIASRDAEVPAPQIRGFLRGVYEWTTVSSEHLGAAVRARVLLFSEVLSPLRPHVTLP